MSSNNVDERVVKMTFDNDQFEAGVKQTLSSLEELKQSLKFNNSLTGIQAVSSAFNSFSLANITTQIDQLTNRFSTLGIVGMTAIENITNKIMNFASSKISSTLGQITSGGWARASSIAQSRFTLQGLLNDEEKVQEAFDSASNAVDGTAYSLNSAVAAASQLAASGIDVGEEMENTLKGIAGTAAMTGDSFDSIANIFTTVAGNGRLMGMQLTQLSAHGLNAAATIANYLGTTEAEVRDMTSKGKIDFETFSAAMQSAFGEHAKDANKTFSGSMDNIKSALSRIGAIFSSGIIENDDLINALNQIRITINSIKTAMLPLEDKFKNLVSAVSNAFSGILGEFNVEPLEAFINIVGEAMDAVTWLINTWSRAKGYLKESIFGEETEEKIEATAEQLERANEAVQKANDIWEKAAYGVGEARKELLGDDYDIVQSLVNQRAAGVTDLEDIALQSVIKSDEALKEENKTIAQTNQELDEVPKKISPIASVISAMTTFGAGLKTIFGNIKTTISKLAISFKKVFSWKDLRQDILDYGNLFSEFVGYFALTEERSTKLESVFTGLWSALDLLRMVIKAVAGGLSKILGPVLSVIFDVILTIAAKVGYLVTKFREWYKENDLLKSILWTLGTVIQTVVSYVVTFFKELNQLPAVQKIKDALKEFADLIGDKLLGYLGETQEAISDFFGTMDKAEDNPKMKVVLEKINEALENIITFSEEAKDKFTEFTTWVSEKGESLFGASKDAESLSKKVEGIKKAGNSLVQGEGITAFLTNLSGVFGSFSDEVDKFIDWIVAKFNSLDATKVALVGFGASITTMGLSFSYLSWNLGNFIKSFTMIPTEISGTIKSVKGVFKSMSEYIKNDSQAKLIKAYAIAIAVLAASFVALTLVDQEKLERSSKVLLSAMGIMAATIGVVALIAGKYSKDFIATNSMLNHISLMFIAVASAAFIMAEALMVLDQMDWKSDDWWKPLATMAGMMVALVAVAIAVSKWAGKLSSGALTIVAMGAAVWLIAKALQALNNVQTAGLDAKIDALKEVLITLSACFVVINLLARGNGVMSAFAVLEMITAILLIEFALYGIVYFGVSMDTIRDNLDKFYPVLIALGIIAAAVAAIGIFSKQAISMTGTILAFAVATLIMVYAIKKLSDIARSGDLETGIVALSTIFIDLFTLMFVIDKVSKIAQGIGKELIALTVAVGIMAVIVYALSNIKDIESFRMGVLMALVCVALVGALAAVSRLAKEVDYKSLYAMVVALGVIVVAVTLMSLIEDKMALLQAAGILGLALISFGAALYLASEWAGQINTKSIVAMVLMIGMVTSSLYLLLDKAGGDYKSMLSAAASLSLVLLAVAGAMWLIGKSFVGSTTNTVKSRLKMLAEMIVMVGIIAVALSALTLSIGYSGTEAMEAAVISLLVVLAAITVGISALATKGLKFNEDTSKMIILMIITLAVAAGALSVLAMATKSAGSDNLYASVIALGLILVTIGITLGIISKLAGSMSTQSVVAFGLAIAVLAAAAASLWLVLGTGADWQTMKTASEAMCKVLIAVSIAIGILAGIASSGTGLGIILAVAAALSVTMLALGYSMKLAANAIKVIVKALGDLTKVNFEVLEENAGTLLKMIGLFAALSLTTFVLGAGLMVVGTGLSFVGAGLVVVGVGATTVAIALALIGATIIVVTSSVTNFIVALNNLIDTFKTSKGEISAGISEIGTGLANGITNFITTLSSKSSTIRQSLKTLVEDGVGVISDGINAINNAILDGIITFLTTLETKIPVINTKINNVIIAILIGVAKNAGTYGYYGAVIAIAFLYGVSQGLVEYGPQLGQTIGNVIIALFEMAEGLISTLMPGLTDLFYEGILNMSEALWGLLAMTGSEAAEENYQTILDERASRSVTQKAKEAVKTYGDTYNDEMNKQSSGMANTTADAVDEATDQSDTASQNGKGTIDALLGGMEQKMSSGNALDGVKSKILDNFDIDLTSTGDSAIGSFFSGANTGIEEYKIDASSIPASVKDQLESEGYKESGQYMVKEIETSINDTSDFNLDMFSDTVMDELPDGEDGYGSGETVKEEWVNGMTSATEEEKARIYHTYSTLANEADEGARDALDINSPSKKAMALRDSWVEGFVKIDSEVANQVSTAYGDLANTSVVAAANMMSSISKIVQDDSVDWTPTLTPVIDGTQLQNGSNLLTATFGNSALNLAADTALSVNDASASSLAEQVAQLSNEVKRLADTDYSKMLDGVNINVNSQTTVDGTPLRKMASSYTIQQVDAQQRAYNMSRGARA